MHPVKKIQFEIATIHDMAYNPHVDKYLKVLEDLIKDGYILVFYMDGEVSTTIRDLKHFSNFKKSFNL
ncbi:hypothetical protein [Aquimarina sp. MMG016]|uniref:hypothetical protein n=1 Tax=Aquimarina sp. MMG016 TaxID=2822690 RepID=UPI001B39D199|nr:hypothetical protein [Aquimarina sp. MMG016]MBQ4818618.1 hypothetical protein [Aquimarina sp. MMG016]